MESNQTINGAPVWSESYTQTPKFTESSNTLNKKIFFAYTINE